MKEPFRHNDHHHCIHTKNIFSLLDLDQKDVMYNFLKSHEKKCTQCSQQLKKFKEENMAIKIFVPKPFMPKDLRETFNGEVSELFKIAGLNEKENQKKRLKNKLRVLDHAGEDFLKMLSSKSMLKAYAFAALVFLGLKYFLN